MSFNSEVFYKMAKSHGAFDIVANFAAHKHVRSEKDSFSIEAMIKNNVLDANIDISGDFYIRYQSFKAFLEIGNIADTATIYLTGNGNFSSSIDGTMDLTFSEPNLPGQIECSILLTKLD